MRENDVVDLKLSAHLLKLMQNEKIPFEKKKGKMDYLIKMGADVNEQVYGKSMALWAKELGDEELIKYIKEKGGVESQISKEKRDELGCQFWDDEGKIKSLKEINELVLMGADLSVKNNNDEQIWKNLSVDDINEVLKDLPKGYVIDGDVYLCSNNLEKLPTFEGIKIGGSFYCYKANLTSLEGAPKEVEGDFNCSSNKLISLKGAPERVGRSFKCEGNQLTSLEGAPSEVGWDFDCSNNQLTSFDGMPKKIRRNFDCSHNKLVSLKGAPDVIEGCFSCNFNKLVSLEYGPSVVNVDFYCSNNQLVSLKGAPERVGRNFNCGANQLISLEGKPLEVGGVFMIENEVLERIEKNRKNKFWGMFFREKDSI